MDSNLIIQYAERLAAPRTLLPHDLDALQYTLRILGLALAACEKSIQIVYERSLRPPEKHHQPWLDRVTGQVLAAYAQLEREFAQLRPRATSESIDQAGLTTAVAWQFTQSMIGEIVVAANYPAIAEFSARAETLPEFLAFPPTGPGVPAR
jgi:glutathione S-transferase